jgi:hypothetical protein
MAKAHTLADNFNDNTKDTAKWYDYGPVSEVNQRLEIRPTSGDSVYGGYTSTASYDLTDSQVTVEVPRVLRNVGSAETYLGIANTAGDRVVLKVGEGTIYCSRRAAGATASTHLGEIPYDAAAHRWWRVREQYGTLHFELSGDGRAWTTLAAIPTPFSLAAVTIDLAAGTYLDAPSPGVAVFDSLNTPDARIGRRVEERRDAARDLRVEAAELAASREHAEHANNNDEVNYPTRPLVGNYSKSFKHDSLGDPDPASYLTLLRALQSEDPGDFEEIQLASSTALKLTNPQAGLAFDLEGPDAQALTQPPAPRFDSAQTAHEAGELYWMAVARDVHFADYGSSAIISAAVTSLNGEFPQFGGTVPVAAQNVFRGIFAGERWGRTSRSSSSRGTATRASRPGAGATPTRGTSPTARG